MMTVQTATISEATFEPNIQAISVLESTTNVALRPETDGRVVRVLARDGQQVKAGQPILVLDNVPWAFCDPSKCTSAGSNTPAK